MNMDEIYESLAANLESRSGVKINSGGDMALRLRAVAAELASLWTQVRWLKNQCFPQTASGEHLDKHAAVRGLTRKDGSKAVGLLRFESSGAAVSQLFVPAGTVCTSLGGVEFVTTEQGTIDQGESFCLVAAEAVRPGSLGNVPAESICQMVLAPVGIARCVNPEYFIGGGDAEEDESLRARIIASYGRLPNGSNAAYYESEALNTDGVAAVKVFPKARGLGTVDVVVAGASYPPAEELLSELNSKFDAEREICVDVQVLAPEPVFVDIAAAVKVQAGYEVSEVLKRVEQALTQLFDGRLLGQDLLVAKLSNVIFSVDGVANYTISAPGSDLIVEENQLPVAGTIVITEKE